MKRWRRTKAWTKTHNELLLLFGVGLGIFALVFSIGAFVYQNQTSDQAQRVLQSEIDAAFRALSAIQHGANAAIFQQPSGQYSVGFSQGMHVNMNISVSLSGFCKVFCTVSEK